MFRGFLKAFLKGSVDDIIYRDSLVNRSSFISCNLTCGPLVQPRTQDLHWQIDVRPRHWRISVVLAHVKHYTRGDTRMCHEHANCKGRRLKIQRNPPGNRLFSLPPFLQLVTHLQLGREGGVQAPGLFCPVLHDEVSTCTRTSGIWWCATETRWTAYGSALILTPSGCSCPAQPQSTRSTRYYSLGLNVSTATSYGRLGTGGSRRMGTYALPPTRYTVTTRMTPH